MTRPAGPKERILGWTEEKAPPVHTFLTHEGALWSGARTIVSLAVVLGLGVLLLWGGTNQPLGETPVVVIESGSMMHCANGINLHGDQCESSSWGRLGTIDPGDLVFVRNADEGVETDAEGGKERFGRSGDVIVYARGNGLAPIIHRAMFWLEINEDGTYDIPDLGLSGLTDLDHPALTDADRWGLRGHGGCGGIRIANGLGPEDSGYITKGDNNPCWDQGGGIWSAPVLPEQILGKSRGEIPWIGMLKLWVFDMLSDTSNYKAAPGDVKTMLWVSVAVLVVVPYGIEYAVKRRRDNLDAAFAAEQAAADGSGSGTDGDAAEAGAETFAAEQDAGGLDEASVNDAPADENASDSKES